MTQNYVIGEAKEDTSESKRKSNSIAVGVLLGVVAGAGIHSTIHHLGILEFAILGALGGCVVRFALLPLLSKSKG